MKIIKLVSLVAFLGFALSAGAESVPEDQIATLRQAPLNTQIKPARMQNVRNTDGILMRNYPTQPPVIPHKIDGYQVNLKVNRCMSCHARNRTEESQAPMVSVTHYMDRDNNSLLAVSPRRYFCRQCHVPQLDPKILVENDFMDMDRLIKVETKPQKEH
jgi:cytochrome c-type protein NapB